MYTYRPESDITPKETHPTARNGTKKQEPNAAFVYAGVSAFCIAIHLIYSRFSHGVSSPWMTWMFLWPLLGGVLPRLLLIRLPAALQPAPSAKQLYRYGIAALTMASLLTGILEIAGTASPHPARMLTAGIILFIAAILQYVITLLRRKLREIW